MGRRKKEPRSVHCESIAKAAGRLFLEKGIQATTMDDVAKEAGYSKATLYVYFSNKKEIVDTLILKGMAMLYDCIHNAVIQHTSTWEKYQSICSELVRCQEQEPLCFSLTLGEIQTGLEEREAPSTQKEIFDKGEDINQELLGFLHDGIKKGDLSPNTENLETVFLFWAALSGLIQMAAKKQAYLEKSLGQSKQDFLQRGFDRLYCLLLQEGYRK